MGRSRSFHWQSALPHPIDEVFAWHTRPGAFERLNAPWRPVQLTQSSGAITTGARVEIRMPVLPGVRIPWQLEHTAFEPPHLFRDEQLHGPFRSWRHTHSFVVEQSGSTIMRDAIDYELPWGMNLFNCFVTRELRRLFAYRHSLLAADLDLHSRWRHAPRKTVLIAGASGFIGQALRAFLSTGGHSVRTLVRRAPCTAGEHFWDPSQGILDPDVFSGVDVVINLCGENIAARRWTSPQKLRIAQSRTSATGLLARTIASLQTPPEVCISASGVGYYGDTGTRTVDESSTPGSDFLARVCVDWEAATSPLAASACRNVQLRIGMVLNAAGGALATMLPVFLCGVGGALGTGRQYVSWIGLQDLLGVIEHVIYSHQLRGPVNCVSPQPCTNREFTTTLARVLKRPALLPAPTFALTIALGEMSQMLLSSSRVYPKSLLDSEYRFLHSDLAHALELACGRIA